MKSRNSSQCNETMLVMFIGIWQRCSVGRVLSRLQLKYRRRCQRRRKLFCWEMIVPRRKWVVCLHPCHHRSRLSLASMSLRSVGNLLCRRTFTFQH